MIAIQGYYNGTVFVPLEEINLRINQKVIITALDEVISPEPRNLGTLEKKATVSFSENWNISDEELVGE